MTVSKSASIICQKLHFAKQIKVMPVYTEVQGVAKGSFWLVLILFHIIS